MDSGLLALIIVPVAVLGPVFYFLFYGSDIFGLPKASILLYIAAVVLGHIYWKPLVLITLALTWSLIVISWGMILWGIIRGK
jgi:hypothetical protein